MSNERHAVGTRIRVRGGNTISPALVMVLEVRGARLKYIRNSVHVLEYDHLHVRQMRAWNRKDPVMQPDKVVEWRGRRLVQDFRQFWPVSRGHIARISLQRTANQFPQ